MNRAYLLISDTTAKSYGNLYFRILEEYDRAYARLDDLGHLSKDGVKVHVKLARSLYDQIGQRYRQEFDTQVRVNCQTAAPRVKRRAIKFCEKKR